MKNASGKILGTGIGASLGFTMNSLDKKNKGSSVPEYIVKSIAVYALYSYAQEREDVMLENCALGYLSYETVRMTSIGRPKDTNASTGSLSGVNHQTQTGLSTKMSQPDFLQGVGSALRGISSVLGAFKGNGESE